MPGHDHDENVAALTAWGGGVSAQATTILNTFQGNLPQLQTVWTDAVIDGEAYVMGSGRNVTNDGELLDVQPGRPLVVFTRKALDYERKEADRVFKVLCKISTCDSELIGECFL